MLPLTNLKKSKTHPKLSALVGLMSSLALLIILFPNVTFAEETATCGDIITSENDTEIRTPIDDCADPFNLKISSGERDFPYSLNDQVLTAGEVRMVESLPVLIDLPFSELTSDFNYFSFSLYRHEGEDYRLLQQVNYNQPLDIVLQANATGTYTIVTSFENVETVGLNTVDRAWYQKFLGWFVNKAHAAVIQLPPDLDDLIIRSALTFTIALPEKPAGASNILFIPGIMGSRLYEMSDSCGSKVEEQERWYSRDECDQLRLKTNYLGQSLNTIYTYASELSIVDEISFPALPEPNIYKSLLSDLKAWKNEDIINDYNVLPYDWRLRLDDLIKMSRDQTTNKVTLDSNSTINQSYLYETLSRLAQSSKNGKVTMITHSNGGLLIKYFLHELSLTNDSLADKIDNLILVAVPQVGTPESVIGVLHGVQLGAGGIVMDNQTSRTLLKSAPFGFHLLTMPSYFASNDTGVLTPVISFDSGSVTDFWRSQFGPTISTFDDLRDFLREESGRTMPDEGDLSIPAVINDSAFGYIGMLEGVFANWQPNKDTKVYQIAGVGLDTPSGLTYFTDVKCTEKSFFSCIKYEKQLGFRINSILDGDSTVVSPSALALSEDDQVERWWVNLNSYGENIFTGRTHRDILEIEDIRNFILNIAKASTTESYEYLSNEPPILPTGDRLIFQLHSPLDMFMVLNDGVVVSSSTNSFRNVQYRRFGEVQYISVPNTEKNFSLKLQGLAEGSFTLDIEKYSGDSFQERITYSAIPTATSTKATLLITAIEDMTTETILPIDYDGDGKIDVRYTKEGEVVEEDTSVGYEDLLSYINGLDLSRSRTKILISLTKVAEKFYERTAKHSKYQYLERIALQVLQHKVRQYEKLEWITVEQAEDLSSIINALINKE